MRVEPGGAIVARWRGTPILLVAALTATMGLGASVTGSSSPAGAAPGPACVPDPDPVFDLDHGNAAVELVIPPTIGATLTAVSPGANDAPLVLRITQLVTNGWFDAIAPYHSDGTAVGVYSDLGHLAPGETDRERNTAILYASQAVLDSLLPEFAGAWDEMLCAAGLDPGDSSDDVSTAVGVGNVAGAAVVAARVDDGMNQLNGYADTTGYEPVNSATDLVDPSRWQPLLIADGEGDVASQTFITPQWSQVAAYSYADVNQFGTPPPTDSVPRGNKGRAAYQAQLDEVIEVSENLTAQQKLLADFFENKFASLGFSALAVLQSKGLPLEEFVQYDFLVNAAATDAGIAIWNEKIRHDAVRPVTAIHYWYGGERLEGWGGPPRPVDLGLTTWTSYLNTGDHPEYPSGSAGFCSAHAEASRLFLASDVLDWDVDLSDGSPIVNFLGVVPTEGAGLHFETWTQFEEECGLSRLYGGVHFRPAITEAQTMTSPIGALAYEFVRAHIEGTP